MEATAAEAAAATAAWTATARAATAATWTATRRGFRGAARTLWGPWSLARAPAPRLPLFLLLPLMLMLPPSLLCTLLPTWPK